MSLLEARGLKKYFSFKEGFVFRKTKYVRAVDGVDIKIGYRETVGLAGESGCGKTTLGRLLIGLIPRDAGRISLSGREIWLDDDKEKTPSIRKEMQMIFQNPLASLNPRKTVFQIISQPLTIHGICEEDELESEVSRLLSTVGLNPPSSFVSRYPHELSGGQRQRIGIARSVATRPHLIIADEPVSALDVSVRGQILNLIKSFQLESGLALLLITHELGILRSMAHRILIMYLGRIVEAADAALIFEHPRHPYTEALLSATPIPDPRLARSRKRTELKGELPSPTEPLSGCVFHTRCPHVRAKCSAVEPPEVTEGSRAYLCHYPL